MSHKIMTSVFPSFAFFETKYSLNDLQNLNDALTL